MTLDEKLIAYVDGELSGAELATFEAEIAANPRLADEVEKHRTMAARLAMAYAPAIDDKAPGKRKAPAGSRSVARPAFGAAQWAAVAAAGVVGAAAGIAGGYFAWPDEGALVVRDGSIVATGDLREALTSQLAAQPGPLRVGLTFRTAKGRYCRTFISGADSLAGVACRQSDGWVMQTTTAHRPAASPADRAAATEMPAAVISAVDSLIAGVPLDAAAEKAARDKGWK